MVQIEVVKNVHTSDIKDGVIHNGLLYTVGRDRHVRVSTLDGLEEVWVSKDLGAPANSVCVHKECVYVGLQTGEILRYRISSKKEASGKAEEGAVSLELESRDAVHSDNVCSLSECSEGVLSTSWDSTVGLTRESGPSEVSKIENTAWSAKKLPESDTVLAGSINGAVSVLRKVSGTYQQEKGLKMHSTCIRDIVMEADRYVSVSNTGVVIASTHSGRVLHKTDLNNTSFRVNAYAGESVRGYIVASDQGMVYVLDQNLESLFSIAAPTLSCWNAVAHEGRVYVLGSDGRIYVFGENKSEKYQKVLEEIQDELNSARKSAEEKAPSPAAASSEEKDSPRYKVVDGNVYVMKDGEWELFGNQIEEKKKDHTITITLGSASYTLSFDKTENYYDVACGFVKQNNLGAEYVPEIVEFLNKNFSKPEKRDISKYFVYDTINMEVVGKKIESLPNAPEVVEYLKKTQETGSPQENEREIEAILGEWLENGTEKIAVLDIYKYLIAKGADFDLFFLKSLKPLECKKTALVFALIATNVLAMRPECRTLVDVTMMKIIDKGLVNVKILQNYKNNKNV
ncbi:phospholipase A-2-activating protein [Nematocida major]|uniref:phospholipase A-2-activating protein n=1 Tax=Nematocida major TaxID=1912982 RepID=UPI0020085B56|nr:phospholipase A-2-activating protein [Nematocida major]KAH9385154.1 phospholipase A-2-activating protein [Nematocida major]